MYCVAFSCKNWYDAKDMRATGGNDVNFAMDAPKVDSPDIAEPARRRARSVYAVATAANVGGASVARRRRSAKSVHAGRQPGVRRSGAASPAIPTTPSACRAARAPARACRSPRTWRPARSASRRSASCKGPASRNNIVNLLTTKGIMMDGGIGQQERRRSRRHPLPHRRRRRDGARRRSRATSRDDMFTAIPKALIPKEPYASFLVARRGRRSASR